MLALRIATCAIMTLVVRANKSDFSYQLYVKSTFIYDEFINQHLFKVIFSTDLK